MKPISSSRLHECNFITLAALLAFSFCAVLFASDACAEETLPAEQSIESVVDIYINARIAEEKAAVAEQVDDAAFTRRLYLDLVGRIPTAVEAAAYAQSSDENKRGQLVERLIHSPAFSRQQAYEFNAFLMAGVAGRNMEAYLQTAFQNKKPWNRIFRDAIIGEKEDVKQEGAISFVRSRVKDLDQLSNDASVIFFGVNISCAQCHDHPEVGEWTQDRYYGFKSFFTRTFENGGFVGEHEYGRISFKTTAGESFDASLMFLTGTKLEEPTPKNLSEEEKKQEKERLKELKEKKEPPQLPGYSRRAKLVDIALQDGENEYFSRAIVNRIWARFIGRGLVTPLDQMHPENPPSHPELLAWLSRDLIAHQYDIPRLIAGITNSKTYARSSRFVGKRPAADLFAVGYVRPLSPRQLANLLHVAVTNPDAFTAEMSEKEFEAKILSLEKRAASLIKYFPYPTRDFQVGASEALFFSNNEAIRKELLRSDKSSLLSKAASVERSQLIDVLYANIFSRPPREKETAVMNAFLNQEGGSARGEILPRRVEHLVWAMLASGECRFNY